jgi:hypothetical protein
MSKEDDANTLWPVGTLAERMKNGTDFDEHGNVNIGPEEEMLARHRAWRAEHEAVLRALGIPIAGVDEPLAPAAPPLPEVEPEEGDDDLAGPLGPARLRRPVKRRGSAPACSRPLPAEREQGKINSLEALISAGKFAGGYRRIL